MAKITYLTPEFWDVQQADLVTLFGDMQRDIDTKVPDGDSRLTDQRVPVGVSATADPGEFLNHRGEWVKPPTGTTTTPPSSGAGPAVAGLVSRWDAADLALSPGAGVSRWVDTAGKNAWANADAGWQPKYGRDTDGTPFVQFGGQTALDSTVDVALDEVTVIARVWLDDTTGVRTLLTSQQGGGLTYRVEGGYLELIHTNTAALGSATGQVAAGAWQTIAWRMSRAASKAAFFIGGAPSGVDQAPGVVLTTGIPSTLGYRDNGEEWKGRVRWLELYSRALTDAEIAQLNAGSATGGGSAAATITATETAAGSGLYTLDIG